MQHVTPRTTQPFVTAGLCGRAEVSKRRCVCLAKQSSTSPGTKAPPVFVSPALAGSSADLDTEPPPPDPKGSDGLLKWLKRTIRSTERSLSNLQLAIAELAVLAVLSGIGTIIDQEQTLDWYKTNYPDGPVKVLGFLDYNLLFALQLDHIYTSNYFLGISALLTASLIACSKTQQWPLLKISKRWSFPSRPEQVFAKGNGETLPRADVKDLGKLLREKNYEVFLKDGAMYGFKGIAGRFAPIGVHISLVLILFGAAYGALAGLDGAAMLAEGDQMVVGSQLRGGLVGLANLGLPDGARKVITLEKFDIDYRSDGSVGQYRSILTESDLDGRIEKQQEIYVNEPMRFGGVTIYQTDWAISRVGLRIGTGADAPQAVLPLTELGSRLGMNSSAKIYGTFIPLEVPDGINTPRGISIIARDLQQVVLYDSQGRFAGVRRPGSGKPIEIEGQQLVVETLTGASGIQLKHDPGVVYVYTGFGFLMITTLLSYISHSQVWALQEGSDVHVGGKSNRAVVMFAQELGELLEEMPERTVAVQDKPVESKPGVQVENGSI